MDKLQSYIEQAKMRADTIKLPYIEDVLFTINNRFSNSKGKCKYNYSTGFCKIELSGLMR